MKYVPTDKVNRHFVFIEAPEALVWPEVLLWGGAPWWPKACAMRFVPTTAGEPGVGSRFRQEVSVGFLTRFVPPWDCEITRVVPGKEIERTFLNGILTGTERVTIEGRVNGTRVEYLMRYRIARRRHALL